MKLANEIMPYGEKVANVRGIMLITGMNILLAVSNLHRTLNRKSLGPSIRR